ncbi:predicted protein [Histoplasma capsulatum var. duboisii H88]|uniref:Predicted protein n=1 Tax=Ajellomyces capsulatus (strain H88) TaxID=544711 RepID=F0U944_AJEC8|nr:predicted protein [Histoplasma capsulatum var. duboisii H88]
MARTICGINRKSSPSIAWIYRRSKYPFDHGRRSRVSPGAALVAFGFRLRHSSLRPTSRDSLLLLPSLAAPPHWGRLGNNLRPSPASSDCKAAHRVPLHAQYAQYAQRSAAELAKRHAQLRKTRDVAVWASLLCMPG